MSSNLESFE